MDILAPLHVMMFVMNSFTYNVYIASTCVRSHVPYMV